MAQPYAPQIRPLLEIRPIALRPERYVEEKAQPPRVMVDDDLQAVPGAQVSEQFLDDAVSQTRFDFRDLDHALVLVGIGHAVTGCCRVRLSKPISVGPYDSANPRNATAQPNAATCNSGRLWAGARIAQMRATTEMMTAA